MAKRDYSINVLCVKSFRLPMTVLGILVYSCKLYFCSYAHVAGREALLLCLTNLCKCLSEHFAEKDQSDFLTKTLPQITQLASELPKLVPVDGIPFMRQQRGILFFACDFANITMSVIGIFFVANSLSLTRRLVASLLANGFLCTYLEQGSGNYEGSELNFDKFFSVFSWEDK